MKSKECNKCRVTKSLDNFYTSKKSKDGYNYNCKECANSYSKNWRKRNPDRSKQAVKTWHVKNKEYFDNYLVNYRKDNKEKLIKKSKEYYSANKVKMIALATRNMLKTKDGNYHVYILPEEHYCGQTDNPTTRKYDHTSKGRILDGFEVIMSFNTRKEAKFVEAAFHALGWYGKATNDKTYCLKTRKYLTT